MTPSQLADYLGVPEHTLAQWRSRKEGPPYLKVGALVRYDSDDIEAWLAETRRTPQPA